VKVALYVRISTPDQNADLQTRELTDYAERQGWTIVANYSDVISGAKARRPGLDKLKADLSALPSRKFDCVMVWKLDRFGRSVTDCLANIELLETHEIRFIATSQGIDTDSKNPAARFMLVVLSAAAEFERTLIVERSQAGMARYRQDYEAGKVGRTVHSRTGKDLPPHRPKRVFDREKLVELHRQGMSLRKIAKKLGVGLGTVSRTLEDLCKHPSGPGGRGRSS
jgi:putative DNA-invertase from lambdoid prophage Rac